MIMDHTKDTLIKSFNLDEETLDKIINILSSNNGDFDKKFELITQLNVEHSEILVLSLHFLTLLDAYCIFALEHLVKKEAMKKEAMKKDEHDFKYHLLELFNTILALQTEMTDKKKEKLMLSMFILPLLVSTGMFPLSYIGEILNQLQKLHNFSLEDIVSAVNNALALVTNYFGSNSSTSNVVLH